MMTVKEYINSNENPFFENGSVLYAPFDDEQTRSELTQYIKFNHGKLQIRPTLEEELETDPKVIKSIIGNLLYSKKYQYTTLWNTTVMEYNPLETYSISEKSNDSIAGNGSKEYTNTTTDSESNNSSHKYGAVTQSGSNNSTSNIGAQKTTVASKKNTTLGNSTNVTQETDTKTGKQIDEHEVTPYDSDAYTSNTKDTSTYSGIVNDKTTQEKIGEKVNIENGTDTTDIDAKTNTETGTTLNTVSEHTDTDVDTSEKSGTLNGNESESNTKTISHSSNKSGNIGSIPLQTLIKSERNISYFNFLSIVAHDIIHLIAICIY